MTVIEERINVSSIENIIEDFNGLNDEERKCFIDYVREVLEDSVLCDSYEIKFSPNGHVENYQGVIISQYLALNKNVFYSPATVQGVINRMQKSKE